MGAVHFLEHEFSMQDKDDTNTTHELELFETGGKLYLRLWVDGISLNKPITCLISQDQATQLAEGTKNLASRLGH